MLEAFEAHYESLFSQFPTGMARIDLDGVIREANAALVRRSGFSNEELTGRLARDFASAQTAPSIDELIDELRGGNSAQRDVRLVMKAGTTVPRRCTVVPSFAGGRVTGGFFAIQDITEKVQAEHLMRSLFDNHPHGIAHVDSSGTVLEANGALLAMSGYAREELIGRHFMTFSSGHTGALTARLLTDTLKGEPQTAEVHPLRKDGSTGNLNLTTTPARVDGKVRGAFFIFEDLSEIRDSEQRFRSLFTQNPDGVIAVDRDGTILLINDALLAIGGYPREAVIGQDYRGFMSEEDLAIVSPYIKRVLEGDAVNYEFVFHGTKGARTLKVTSFPMLRAGEIAGYYAIMIDATEERAAQSRAREQEHRIRELYLLAAAANIGDVQITTMLETGCRLLDMEMAAIVDCSASLRIERRTDLHPLLTASLADDGILALANAVKESRRSLAVTPAAPVTGTYPYGLAIPLNVEGVFYGVLCFAGTVRQDERVHQTDVDLAAVISALLGSALERRRSRADLRTLAYFDSLTGLPNRLSIQERLRDSLEAAQTNLRRVALIVFDLDRFKDVNDTLGHAMGDRLLQLVSARLVQTVRERGMVARMGGDEFAVLLPNCDSIDEIRKTTEELLQEIDAPFQIDEYEQFVTASAGISIFPDDGKDDQALIKNADIAMYRAKDLGRNAYQLYAPSLEASIQMRLSQEKHLRRALANEEFVVYYQPQVDLLSGKIVALEGLVRWNHPKTGIIFPGRFIPSAEISGLIVPLGDWVLRTATVQGQAWQEAFPGLRIAVNLSAKQFHQPDLRARILSALESSRLSADLLELEITESVAMTDAEASVQIMRDLVDAGVGIGLDDFGTGYSSLSYLRRFPAEVLKIDRSFVTGIGTQANDETIVITVIAMAHNLGLEVVAEGVETAEQYDFLRTYGCDRVQGYYISPAVSAGGMTDLLKEWRPHVQ